MFHAYTVVAATHTERGVHEGDRGVDDRGGGGVAGARGEPVGAPTRGNQSVGDVQTHERQRRRSKSQLSVYLWGAGAKER